MKRFILTDIHRHLFALPILFGAVGLTHTLLKLEAKGLIDIVLDDDRVSFETRGFLDKSENANGQRKLGRYIRGGSAR